MRIWSGIVVLLVAGCGGASGVDAGVDAGSDGRVDAGVDAGFDAGVDAGVDAGLPVLGLVTGVRAAHFVQRSGLTEVPIDGVASPLQVYVWDGGSFGAVPVTVTDGGFRFITTLRPYWIGAEGSWLVSSSDTLDLGHDVVGRPGAARNDGGTFSVTLSLAGLSPWVTNRDELTLMTDAVDQAWGGWFPNFSIDAGATALSGSFDFTSGFDTSPLLQADQVYLAQQRNTLLDGGRSADGGQITGFTQTLVAASAATSLTLPAPGPVSATFTPLTLHSTTITFDAAAFDLAAAANPLATQAACSIDVYAYLDLQRGATGYLGSLGGLTLRGLSSQSQTLQWGNPSSASAPWAEAASVTCSYKRTVMLAGTTAGTTISAHALLFGSPTALLGDVLRPTMSPPRQLKLDGVPALTAPLTLSGPSPLVSWGAPVIGVPNVYFAVFTELSGASGETVQLGQVSFTTTATELRVPPGVLQSGHTYVVEVSASNLSGGMFKADSAPFYDSASNHQGSAVSALLTVP